MARAITRATSIGSPAMRAIGPRLVGRGGAAGDDVVEIGVDGGGVAGRGGVAPASAVSVDSFAPTVAAKCVLISPGSISTTAIPNGRSS